jgi:hypothetical protein
VLSAEDVQAVADAYGQERAYLVKCQHLILKTACECVLASGVALSGSCLQGSSSCPGLGASCATPLMHQSRVSQPTWMALLRLIR